MTLVRFSIAATLAGGLFLACSDDPTAGPSAQPPTTPGTTSDAGDGVTPGPGPTTDAATEPDTGAAQSLIAAYDEDIARAICAKLDSCCSTASYDTFFGSFTQKPYDLKASPPRADCVKALSGQYGKLHSKWAASIAKGRIEFVPARAKKCVDDMKAAACGVQLTKALYDPACFAQRGNEVFVKRAATGTPCTDIGDGTFFGECDPKLGYCGSDGTCQAWKKTGEPCSVTPTRQFCSPELECDGLSPKAPGTCTAGPIVRQVGEACVASSGPLIECVAGAYCDWEANTCKLKKADGAACKYDDECVTYHPYTCTPFGGGTCGSTSFCGGAVDGGT